MTEVTGLEAVDRAVELVPEMTLLELFDAACSVLSCLDETEELGHMKSSPDLNLIVSVRAKNAEHDFEVQWTWPLDYDDEGYFF